MSGRFFLAASHERLSQHFGLDPQQLGAIPPRYNIAPGGPILVVHHLPGNGRYLEPMLWGLIPSWMREPQPGSGLFNARSETAQDKPAFRAAFKRRRCLIPASGFYEWQAQVGHKQPYCITVKDQPLFALAGLWEHWLGGDGSELRSATVLTTTANSQMRSIHERMPLIIEPKDYEEWLTTPEMESKHLTHLMQPYTGELVMHAVSTALNNPEHEGPGLIEALVP